MLVCKHTKERKTGHTCGHEDKHRTICDGLVTNCPAYVPDKKDTTKKK